MTTLSSLVIIDNVQPQTAAYMTASSRTKLETRAGNALLALTLMPSVAVEEAIDIALKRCDVQVVFMQMDSRVAYLAMQSPSISEIRGAADAIVTDMRLTLPPDVVKSAHSRLVSKLDPGHSYIKNVNCMGTQCTPGQSLYVYESDPPTYALLAVNEAEKAAHIQIVDFKFTGSMGRVIISGDDSSIRVAGGAVEGAIEEAA